MKMRINQLFQIALFCSLSAFSIAVVKPVSVGSKNGQAALTPQKKIVTLFIHGTIFPVISYYCHGVNSRPGIQLAKRHSKNSLDTFCEILSIAAPEQHPFNSFYWFGWDGKMDEESRFRAAENLYDWLQEHPEVDTAIGHSHGATIILLLEKIAQQRKNARFSINRFVAIACPIQKATQHLITSSLFKKVYSLYSSGDFTQWMGSAISGHFFGERSFMPMNRLVQAQILLEGSNPGHNDFILKNEFISQLPKLLKELDGAKNNNYDHFIAHIRSGKIELHPLS